MTPTQLQLAAHQIGMVRSSKAGALDEWRAHQRQVAALRVEVGAVYAPYPHPNRALVKALYASVREHLISRAEFAACIISIMGRHHA